MKNYTNRIVALLLILCLAVAVFPALPTDLEASAAEVTLNYHSKTFWFTDTAGTHDGTVISGGNLTLASGRTSGTFVSNTINIGTFKYMVASWNAKTNGGNININVQFELSGGSWSGWYSWGTWSSTRGVSGSSDLDGTHATMGIDTLRVKSSYTTTGNIKFRVKLTKTNGTPVVSNVTIATPQMAKQSTVGSYPSYHLNNVPMRSQTASENGSIGGVICSPTTTAMAVEYMGTYASSLSTAYDMYDNVWGRYGNWSFAAAYAGEKGYTAYIDFYDVAMAKYALSQGVVLGCSTMLTASGHIVLLTGYDEANDQFIVNDPAVSPSNPQVTRYSVSYFTQRWFESETNNLGVVYVFQKTRDLESFNNQSPADYANNSMVKIKNVATGKYLTNDSDNNVSVKAGDNSAEQVWKITNAGNSRYSFVNAATGRCLDIIYGGNTSGTNIQTYPSNGAHPQQFFLHKSGSGYNIRPCYTKSVLMNVASNGNVELGTASASSASQQFVLESVSVSLPTDSDYLKLTAMNASQYEDAVQIWTTGTFTAVYWSVLVIQPSENGYKVVQKYKSGDSKSIVASTTNMVVAVYQLQDAALEVIENVQVGDTVSLVGIYPGLGTFATNGHIVVPATFKLIAGSNYQLDDSYVTVKATSLTAKTVCAQFKCKVYAVNANGAALADTDIIGTGCTVQQKNAAGTVIKEVSVVITGDVTGDGVITATDSIALRGVLKSQNVFTGAFLEAADLNEDNTMSTLDYVQMISTIKN